MVVGMKLVISDAGRDWRGTESVTLLLANGFRERGHNVVVFCAPGSRLQEHLAAAAIPYEALLGGSDASPRVLTRIGRALRRHRPQLVLTQKDKDLRQTGLVARASGIPVLVRHVTDRPLKRRLRYRFFFGWVATHHVANSESTRRTLLDSAPWLRDREIPVIHNGIDVARFAHAQPAELDLPEGAIVVGFVGHFELRKGILDFASAWQRIGAAHPDAHALVVGGGGGEADFRAALEGAPRVHWLGFRDDPERIFKRIDIFVMPSKFEGFGLVLAEAMAAGTACVAYASSNLPELVAHEHDGLLVPPGDIEGLANSINRLLRCPDLRRTLGQNAHATAAARFSAERMITEYERLAVRAAQAP